jgi:predicted glycoside hydrolase/deacetylase ChbG (UPF0249 family)
VSDRYLIINADDFGICTETNEAIQQLFREGRITSTTVMACTEQAITSIELAKRDSKIKMGLHATLSSDFLQRKWGSVATIDKVPSLLDEDRKFYGNLNSLYQKASNQEITIELEAQYHFIKDRGYQPTHMDSHCGTLYGLTGRSFMKEAYEICIKYKLPFRFPRSKNYLKAIYGGNIPTLIDEAHTNAILAADDFGISLPNDIRTNPFSIHQIPSYEHLKSFYLDVLRNMEDGITELFLHPSKENESYLSFSPEWQKRLWEYQFLLEDDVQKIIQQENIKLVSWADAPFEKYKI